MKTPLTKEKKLLFQSVFIVTNILTLTHRREKLFLFFSRKNSRTNLGSTPGNLSSLCSLGVPAKSLSVSLAMDFCTSLQKGEWKRTASKWERSTTAEDFGLRRRDLAL